MSDNVPNVATIEALIVRLFSENRRLHVTKLTKAEEFPFWKERIIRHLKRYDLDKFILEEVPEPQSEEEKRQWCNDRADVEDFLQSSVEDENVWMVLENMGWSPATNDPKDTFDKLRQFFERGPADSEVMMMKELATIRRKGFDSMKSFQLRIIYPRKRLQDTIFRMEDDKAYIWLVAKSIQREYPDLYDRTVSALAANTITWGSLMTELHRLAMIEEAQSKMSSAR